MNMETFTVEGVILKKSELEVPIGPHEFEKMPNDRAIKVNGHYISLKKSLRVHDHSPEGFHWGYGGSGPAQTAIAILQDVFGDEFADQHHQEFKWRVISRMPDKEEFKIVVDKEALTVVCEYA